MKTTKRILIAFTALLLLNGCKPLKETIYVDRWHETTQIDSVYQYLKDTVTLRTSGDSIFITQYKTKIDYKFKYLSKVDTVTSTKTEFKTITKYKTKTVTHWFGWFDWIVVGFILLYFGLRFFKVIKF